MTLHRAPSRFAVRGLTQSTFVSVTNANMCRGSTAVDTGAYFLQCVAELDDTPTPPPRKIDLRQYLSDDDEPESVPTPYQPVAEPSASLAEPSTSGVKGADHYLEIMKLPNFVEKLMEEMAQEEAELAEADQLLEQCKRDYEERVRNDHSLPPLDQILIPSSLQNRLNKVDSQCIVCKQTFASRGTMIRHVERKHPERLEEAKQTRVFNRDPSLKFQCDKCGKGFARKDGLTQHRRRHLMERNHSCPYFDCHKSYLEASELRKHVKRVHKANM
ncbi:hypothetical protein QR680_011134 [Steinernema hermaphroditum]|uniref:C2H2-type domain-containing protein n=1 Tax=Steinernema hermaphroditum TaxID=289476 RepID=A0AA39ISN1_9BILA|nr:hypothetical protein QR680_011134 [Steinernema hermaphroditum]